VRIFFPVVVAVVNRILQRLLLLVGVGLLAGRIGIYYVRVALERGLG
jgi:hypothetical protein